MAKASERSAFWDKVHFYHVAGLGLALVVIVLLVLQRWLVPAYGYGMADYVLLAIGVALVTGIAFWVCTGSTGELSIAQIGLRLGGGAAIGAGFMLLAWQLAKNMNVQPPPTAVVVPLTDDAQNHPETLQVTSHDPTIDRPYLVPRPPTFAVVRFIGDAPEAHFTLRYLAPERRKVMTCVYTVTRRGPKSGTPSVTEEEIDQ